MEVQVSAEKSKIIASIQKSKQLLLQSKQYEFAQKIKALAQRKIQTNKPQQAEWLLYLGSQKMLEQEKTEINAVNELINQLLNLYSKQKDLVNKQTSSQLYKLLNLKPNPQRIQFYSRILRSITKIHESAQIVEDFLCYHESKQQFWKVESLVVHLNFGRISAFLDKWKACIDSDQYSVVCCRMAILKGLYYDFDEPMVILSELPGHHPFVKFTKFLIQAVQMKSRECYQKLGSSYAPFLKSDGFFEAMFELYGFKYFKKERKESQGLFGLFKGLQ